MILLLMAIIVVNGEVDFYTTMVSYSWPHRVAAVFKVADVGEAV